MTETFREFKTIVGKREVIIEVGKYAEQLYYVLRCGGDGF